MNTQSPDKPKCPDLKEAYTAYQLQWLLERGYSLRDLLETVTEIVAEAVETDPMLAVTDAKSAAAMEEVIVNGFWERGFCGELFVCEAEFAECEYEELTLHTAKAVGFLVQRP